MVMKRCLKIFYKTFLLTNDLNFVIANDENQVITIYNFK